jgi:hypothetical protein
MRLERRIREGTQRNAGVVEPDVDGSLSTVVREVRRRRWIHRTSSTVVAIALVAAAIVLGPGVLDAVRGPRLSAVASLPTQVATTSPAGTSGVPATFARTVSRGLAVVRANRLEGRWIIATDARGPMRLNAPAAFAGPTVSWPLEQTADQLRTSAFGGDLCAGYRAGTYHWTRVSRFLILDMISDRCDARVWLLTSGPWRSRPSA